MIEPWVEETWEPSEGGRDEAEELETLSSELPSVFFTFVLVWTDDFVELGGGEAWEPPKGEPRRLDMFMFEAVVLEGLDVLGTLLLVEEPMMSSKVGGAPSAVNWSVMLEVKRLGFLKTRFVLRFWTGKKRKGEKDVEGRDLI